MNKIFKTNAWLSHLQPNSSATRFATDMAATLLGWVHPIFPLAANPASAMYWTKTTHFFTEEYKTFFPVRKQFKNF